MEPIQLTLEQKQALVSIAEWMKNPSKPYITLGGYAGTGKTTLTAKLRQLLYKHRPQLVIAFCAFTGKASQVLAATLKLHQATYPNDSVSTIHSLIYAPIIDGSKVIGWKKKESLKVDLIIVDEGSMVDERIWEDLLSFDLPIIVIGDHGQLPPIHGQFNLMANPDLKLETIHRQVADSPIVQVSYLARTEGVIPVGNYGTGVRKLSRYDSVSGQEVEEMLRGFKHDLLILTGYNSTRINLNKQIRAYKDLGKQPQKGDRVICLKNNWEKGIYNGMIGSVSRIHPKEDPNGDIHWYEVDIDFEDADHTFSGIISVHQFDYPETLHEFGGLKGKALGDLFDYGYALTVHKSQGSQSPRVLVFEERFKHMSDDDWRRWLYTAVTRAQEQLTIVGI